MAEICYIAKKFNADHEAIIAHANNICVEYHNQDLVLTLRQLYYQFVARGLIANNKASYDKLGRVVVDARLAGRLDWSFLIDRTRNEVKRSRWDNVGSILEGATKSYHTDLWKGQGVRPVVLVEKDAAIGVIETVCHDNDVPYLSCRGYMSWSELWNFAQRIRYDIECGDRVVILYIGDHDPSGMDMTRDIPERLSKVLYKDWSLLQGAGLPYPRTVGMLKSHMLDYMRGVRWPEGPQTPEDKLEAALLSVQSPLSVKRIALNYDQVQEYNPPPNFANQDDARFQSYFADTGLTDSWELDALDPNVLINLISDELDALRDDAKWSAAMEKRELERITLANITKHYTPVVNFVNELEGRGK